MKKLFTIALVAIATIFSAKADGNFYVGGNIGFMHDSNAKVHNEFVDGNFSVNHFALMPEFGYKFNDRWTAGITVGYEFTHLCGHKLIENMVKVNPYARLTCYRTENGLLEFFVEGGAGLGIGWQKYEHGRSRDSYVWQVGFQPGIAFNFSDKFGLVGKIGFLGYKGANSVAVDSGLHSRKVGISFDSNDLTLGFSFKF